MALCCFTPILVFALTGIGLVFVIDYLEYFLMPLLGFFVVMTGYGIDLYRQEKQCGELPENLNS
jgi:uncharacterized membrane protein